MSNPPPQCSAEAFDDVSPPPDLLRALADERRRTVLSVLVEASSPIDARTVARRVAAREADADAGAISTDRIERVHVSLHHVHLPKLSDVGVTSYDPDRGVVEDAVEDADSIPL